MLDYAGLKVRPRAREALWAAKAAACALTGAAVTLSATLTAAVRVAQAHPEEFARALAEVEADSR